MGERPAPEQERALAHVRASSSGAPADPTWRVTVAFHPDRVAGDVTVMASIARDGLYRNQFETGTSNGGLTAHPGGDRWRWESRMFGGAYDGAPPSMRPVYGALDTRADPYGAAPRFGSSFLRLTPESLRRSTFCYPDSVHEPTSVGVHDRVGTVVALAEQHPLPDPLDRYVEAQVHGRVAAADVEAVVLDPSFRGTGIERVAARLGVPVGWTPGRVLDPHHPGDADELAAYRGREVLDLARSLATDGPLDAAAVGRAARSGRYEPQRVKQVWHLLARFGLPAQGREDAR